jgi:hypothetical protein
MRYKLKTRTNPIRYTILWLYRGMRVGFTPEPKIRIRRWIFCMQPHPIKPKKESNTILI